MSSSSLSNKKTYTNQLYFKVNNLLEWIKVSRWKESVINNYWLGTARKNLCEIRKFQKNKNLSIVTYKAIIKQISVN